MTIYAYEDGPTKTVVAAATTVSELDSFYDQITGSDKTDFVAEFQPDFMLMMTDPVFSKFKKPPIVIEHSDQSQRSDFVARLGIEIVGRNTAISRHEGMLNKVTEEKAAAAPPAERQTLAQSLGLDKEDRWDKRSDEEKEAEEERKKAYKDKFKDAQAKGNLSGDSFDAPADGEAHVTDIRTTIMPDGSVVIDQVRAVKGLHDNSVDQITEAEARVAASSGKNAAVFDNYYYAITTGAPMEGTQTVVMVVEKTFFDQNGHPDLEDENEDLAVVLVSHGFDAIQPAVFAADVDKLTEAPAKRLLDRLSMDHNTKLQEILDQHVPRTNDQGEAINLDENGDNIAIANDGLVPIYFRLEVTGASMEDVAPAFVAAKFPIGKHASVMRNYAKGCWFAAVRKQSAEDACAILTAAGFTAEVVAVDESGDPLLDTNIAGVTVVDTGASVETPIRPWNDRAFEWDFLTEEQKEENRKTWKGEEFIFTGQYTRETGCTITICPKAYFEKTGKTMDVQFDIKHILPEDLKNVGLWEYQTTSRDWNSFTYDMSVKRKFAENWFLQLYLNSLQ